MSDFLVKPIPESHLGFARFDAEKIRGFKLNVKGIGSYTGGDLKENPQCGGFQNLLPPGGLAPPQLEINR